VKPFLRLIAAGLVLASLSSANAIRIDGSFSGTISGGAISEINGSFIYRPVGTPVYATFSYDTAYLAAPDASGYRQDSFFDPSFYFLLLIDGTPFGSWVNGSIPNADAISQFKVDAAGLPVIGRGTGGWDIVISQDSIRLGQPPAGDLAAMINGTFSVPDSVATSWLLGLACTGVVFARRFIR